MDINFWDGYQKPNLTNYFFTKITKIELYLTFMTENVGLKNYNLIKS